jgi:hypothetical protein
MRSAYSEAMDRRPQPATPGDAPAARAGFDFGQSTALQHAWAVTRWFALVFACGVGVATAVAVAVVAVQTAVGS